MINVNRGGREKRAPEARRLTQFG